MKTKILFFILYLYIIKINIVNAQNASFQKCCPTFSWLNQKEGERPKYIWENTEDIIYHELFYPDSLKQTAPEFYSIMRCPWVFNRAMCWEKVENTIIAYSKNGDLDLTGKNQVSAWYSDPKNTITHQDLFSIFEKKNSKRQRDCAVLPAFQFHLGQHPVLELEVSESSDDWQFCASIKGRSGLPFLCSGWNSNAKKMKFDIASMLKDAGYNLNYAEIHFIIGTWNNDPGKNSYIKFKSTLISQPSIIACLPVIRTKENAQKNGVEVTALTTNTNGTPSLYVNYHGKKIPMLKKKNYYSVNLNFDQTGDYEIEFLSENAAICPTKQIIRITEGVFYKYNKENNYFNKGSKINKPITGSYQGTMFFKDCGTRSEQMLLKQEEWDNWDRNEKPGERLISWESFTENELNYRFSYLKQNKWDVVHLHSHYGIWERFDAVGNLAPHGIEQFALYTRVAAKNGLHVMITLSSYPYGINNTLWDEGTCPYMQYIEAGFKNEDWYNTKNQPFNNIYHEYLKDFVQAFKDESSIFSFSSSGEGDWKARWERFQDTKNIIKSIDTNHVIVSEPIMHFDKIPTKMVEYFTSDIVGYRNYALGSNFNSDEEMSLYTKLAQIIPNSFISEGSYPGSNVYTCMTFDDNHPDQNCWVGTDYYRLYLRDWIYFGFVSGMPAIVTWDEVFTEDERLIMKEVQSMIDWSKKKSQAMISILTDDSLSGWDGRMEFAKFERLFSSLALDYRFVENKTDAKANEWFIDTKLFKNQEAKEIYKKIPKKIIDSAPFKIGSDYAAHYFQAEDKSYFVAYINNVTNHEKIKFYLSGNYHRIPQKGELKISKFNFQNGSKYKLYDLTTKELFKEGKINNKTEIDILDTKHDFLLYISKE